MLAKYTYGPRLFVVIGALGGDVEVISIRLLHGTTLELEAKPVKRGREVQHEVEHTVKEDSGEDTPLEESNVKQEKTCSPFRGGHECPEPLIVVKDELLDKKRHTIPV